MRASLLITALPLAAHAWFIGGAFQSVRDGLSLRFGSSGGGGMMPGRTPGSSLDDDLPPAGAPTLGDVIGIDKRASIMSDYALAVDDVARRLSDPDRRTLILAPLNSAIVALPRKPWLGDANADTNTEEVDTQRDEASADRNIARFVQDHVVDGFPIGAGSSVTTLSGQTLKVVQDDENEKKVLIQDGAGVSHRVLATQTASNGAIWLLDGVLTRSARREKSNDQIGTDAHSRHDVL